MKKISQAFIVACLLLVGCTDSESTSARVELAEIEVFLDQNQNYFFAENNYYEFSESDLRCILGDVVDRYGISSTEEMLLSDLSDPIVASVFGHAMVRCVDMIDLFRLDLFKRGVSFSYLDCVTEELTEESVRSFLLTEWVEGNDAFNKRFDAHASLAGCGSPLKEMQRITSTEIKALNNMCSGALQACYDMVNDARGRKPLFVVGAKYPLRGCSYEDLKSWIQEELYKNPEWPLIVEKECN